MLIHFYRFNHWLWKHHVPFLPKLIYYLQYMLFNCSVPASCEMGGVLGSVTAGWPLWFIRELNSVKTASLAPTLPLAGNHTITTCR